MAGDATYTATFLESPRKYEITWVDGNGDTLKTEQVGYGSTPAYNWDIPTKTATAQYTYTFNNTWIPAIVSVVGDATYTAQFDSAVNKYNITFVDEDGTVLKAATAYDYGTAAADITKPADPTKAKDAQYTYTFAGWSPAVSAVTCEVAADCNKTYTATYTPHIRSYTITWKDGDGETLKTDTVEYGQTPSYNWDTPTKTATAQYTYTFNNTWIPAIVSVVGDATYTAQFDHSTRTYTVTWNNRDGTNLETDQNVPYAAYPHYDWSIPHKQGDATHSYRFNWWTKLVEDTPVSVDPTTDPVLWDVTYTADFEEYNGYIVYFDANEWEPVESMEHEGQWARNITLPSTTREWYTFAGWKLWGEGEALPAWSPYSITQNVTFVAQWTPITYTISYYDTDGTTPLVIQNATGSYTIEDAFTIPNPTNKPWYTFAGWREYTQSQAGAQWIEERPWVVYYNISGLSFLQWNKWNRKYVAQWTEKTYSVIWLDEDLQIIHISNVTQWTIAGNITDKPANPTKAQTAQYTYAFAGWTADG